MIETLLNVLDCVNVHFLLTFPIMAQSYREKWRQNFMMRGWMSIGPISWTFKRVFRQKFVEFPNNRLNGNTFHDGGTEFFVLVMEEFVG